MTVVIDLREKSLERYLYLLARLFFEAGYAVHFRAHPEVIGQALKYAGKYGKLILAIPGITLGTGREVDASRAVYLTDVATSTAPDRPWRAVVRVDYDWYGAPDGGLVVPYPMHPLQYEEGWQQSELTEFRRSERTVGVLFSGNADPEYYTSGPVVDTFGLLSRIAILDKLHAGVSDLALLDPPCGAGASQVKAGYDYFIKASSRVEGDTARKMVRTNGWRIKDGD